jgi:hypothetical protein
MPIKTKKVTCFVFYKTKRFYVTYKMAAEYVEKDSRGTSLKEYLLIDIVWGPCLISLDSPFKFMNSFTASWRKANERRQFRDRCYEPALFQEAVTSCSGMWSADFIKKVPSIVCCMYPTYKACMRCTFISLKLRKRLNMNINKFKNPMLVYVLRKAPLE